MIAGYADLIAPGSCIVVSCGRVDDTGLWEQLSGAFTAAPARNHTRAEICRFLGGLELVPPGLVPAQNWRGGWHDAPAVQRGPVYVLGGVAQKGWRDQDGRRIPLAWRAVLSSPYEP